MSGRGRRRAGDARTRDRRGPGRCSCSSLAAAGAGRAPAASASAAPVSIDLCAVPGTAHAARRGRRVPIWGFGIADDARRLRDGDRRACPGRCSTVTEGDTVTITRHQRAAGRAHARRSRSRASTFDPGPTDAAVGADGHPHVHRRAAPGTYLYQSGGDAGRQAAMGLYGALIVRPPTAGQAYDTRDDRVRRARRRSCSSAIDPAFNAAPDTFDMHTYQRDVLADQRQGLPGHRADHGARPGQRVLLRYLNAGFDNTSMTLLGMHEQVRRPGRAAAEQPVRRRRRDDPGRGDRGRDRDRAGRRAPSTHGFPLYNRQLHLTNGDPDRRRARFRRPVAAC